MEPDQFKQKVDALLGASGAATVCGIVSEIGGVFLGDIVSGMSAGTMKTILTEAVSQVQKNLPKLVAACK
jgi:hypothetical protein